ncbi:MAG: hypothetical protein Q9P01_21030 [Anaerolineae bacterium]|nr:hypothetical protein [Anaerolineae bacterium]MDQ7037232.1 hypothetical protein [Anaerolineae bacterium]
MPKPIDDLSQENPLDAETEDTSLAQNMVDAYAPKIQRATGDYAKRSIKRLLWSILLSFTLNDEYQRDRTLDRIERKEKISCFELFFGETFSVFRLLRWIIFLAIIGGLVFYAWQANLLDGLTT